MADTWEEKLGFCFLSKDDVWPPRNELRDPNSNIRGECLSPEFEYEMGPLVTEFVVWPLLSCKIFLPPIGFAPGLLGSVE